MHRSGKLALHQQASPQGGSCCVSGGSALAGVKGHGASSPASRTPLTGGNSPRKSPSSSATGRRESTRAATAYMELVRSHGIPVIALSSQHFRRERGASRFAEVREAYDDATLALLDGALRGFQRDGGLRADLRPDNGGEQAGAEPASGVSRRARGDVAAGHLAAHRVAGRGIRRLHAPRDGGPGPRAGCHLRHLPHIAARGFEGLWAQAEASSVSGVAGDAWRGNPTLSGDPTGRRQARAAAAAGDAEGVRGGAGCESKAGASSMRMGVRPGRSA